MSRKYRDTNNKTTFNTMKSLRNILALGLAAVAGYGIGLLTAPRSGKRTRNKIMDEFDETKGLIEDAASKKLKEAKKILNETVDATKEDGKKAINKLKEKAHLS